MRYRGPSTAANNSFNEPGTGRGRRQGLTFSRRAGRTPISFEASPPGASMRGGEGRRLGLEVPGTWSPDEGLCVQVLRSRHSLGSF
jgi:hypothetical protein